MIYVQIKDNVVINRAVFDAAVPADWPDADSWIANEDAQIGWAYQGGSFIAPTAPAAPPPPTPRLISDRQFFQQLAVQGVISQDEALAAVSTGTLPASMAQLVSQLPSDQQFGANMLLKGAVEFNRSHPMVAVLGSAYGWTSEQLDALWTAAAVL